MQENLVKKRSDGRYQNPGICRFCVLWNKDVLLTYSMIAILTVYIPKWNI